MTLEPRFRSTILLDAARAALELAIARVRLGQSMRGQPTQSYSRIVAALEPASLALVDRIAFVLPRVAARVPWRSDCLVQAIAAKRWLAREGIATRLTLGVPKDKKTVFQAHAWLTAGDRIVTGGDVSGYVPFEKP